MKVISEYHWFKNLLKDTGMSEKAIYLQMKQIFFFFLVNFLLDDFSYLVELWFKIILSLKSDIICTCFHIENV